jgi:hypothetical protein
MGDKAGCLGWRIGCEREEKESGDEQISWEWGVRFSAERPDPVTVIIESMEQDQDGSIRAYCRWNLSNWQPDWGKAAVCEIPLPAILRDHPSSIREPSLKGSLEAFVTTRKLGPLLGDQIWLGSERHPPVTT